MMITYILIKWIHILAMLGTFGGLLLYQLGLPAAARQDPANRRGAGRLWNILIGVGFLAGAAMYGLSHGHQLGAHYNGVVGLKFAILLAVGALLPMSRKAARGDSLRWGAIVLLALAALTGLTL